MHTNLVLIKHGAIRGDVRWRATLCEDVLKYFRRWQGECGEEATGMEDNGREE